MMGRGGASVRFWRTGDVWFWPEADSQSPPPVTRVWGIAAQSQRCQSRMTWGMEFVNMAASCNVVLCFFAIALGATVTKAVEVTPVAEGEMSSLLIGCWAKERANDHDSYYKFCFRGDGSLLGSYFGAGEGVEGVGSYALKDGKLQIDQDGIPVRKFELERVSCDVLLRAQVGVKLYNCVGTGEHRDELIPDASFAFEGPE